VANAGGEAVTEGATLIVRGDGVATDCRTAADAPVSAVIDEFELWRRLGVVGRSGESERLYSPAMLADLVGVPLVAVRRWERRGALRPTKRLNRLALYDFSEARVARLLAELLAATGKLDAVDRVVDQLGRRHPGIERPLTELSLVVEGGGLLVRDGASLSEPGGQKRLEFDRAPAGECADSDGDSGAAVLTLRVPADDEEPPAVDAARGVAGELRDRGELLAAIEAQRLAMLEHGASAEDHFALAEMLYEAGDAAASRERYYTALELDADYLEARVNLGCVLGELGAPLLAIASFRGALETHPDYADAHYQLAVMLDRHGDPDEAAEHWRRFLGVAPDSPWADEARRRLGVSIETTAD
jgi:tetratricopeptide (TPR) repeat protein